MRCRFLPNGGERQRPLATTYSPCRRVVFTLNNYGVFGVDGSAPIINLPEVAMLGLGRIKERPWAVEGQLTVRKVMYLSFVFDHRACDGEEPSQFLTFVADCIENPISLLPEL